MFGRDAGGGGGGGTPGFETEKTGGGGMSIFE